MDTVTHSFSHYLGKVFTLEKVLKDFHTELGAEQEKFEIQLSNGKFVDFEVGMRVEIVARFFVHSVRIRQEQTGYRIVIALGSFENSQLSPEICFAKLHYNEEFELTTIDYYL